MTPHMGVATPYDWKVEETVDAFADAYFRPTFKLPNQEEFHQFMDGFR